MGLEADVAISRGSMDVRAAITADDGTTVALLGPNGAGKTTVVEALAGIASSTGPIELDGVRIEAFPPERRGIGVCFQDDLLFPHLTVLDNIAFGPRAVGTDKRAAHTTAAGWLRRLAPGVDPAAKPRSLSGGERRRVSLARALATAPRLLLLDEPLAGVDVSSRGQIRAMLREVRAGFDGVVILVAHDPIDALTMADRVVIMERGQRVQEGTPDEIRRAPRSQYAADLVGVNIFAGTVERLDDGAAVLRMTTGAITIAPGRDVIPGTPAVATLRPSDVSIHLERPEGSARNVLRGTVEEVAADDERARIRLRTQPPLTAEITAGSVTRLGLSPGTEVWASFKAVEVSVHPESAAALGTAPGTLGG